MKKLVTYLLILILSLGIVGCSKQYSSPTDLKQEYVESFSSLFAIEAEKIARLSVDLYNKSILDIDNTPKREIFESQYQDFEKLSTKNSNEKDFQDSINKFAIHYSLLSTHVSLLKIDQDLRDRGLLSKEKYEASQKKYNQEKVEDLQKVKLDIKKIVKYYQ